jgi:hypothetical protein
MNSKPSNSPLFGRIFALILILVFPPAHSAEPAENSKQRKVATVDAPTSSVIEPCSSQEPEVKFEGKGHAQLDPVATTTATPKAEKLPAFVITASRYKSLLTVGEQTRLKFHFRFHFLWPRLGQDPVKPD